MDVIKFQIRQAILEDAERWYTALQSSQHATTAERVLLWQRKDQAREMLEELRGFNKCFNDAVPS